MYRILKRGTAMPAVIPDPVGVVVEIVGRGRECARMARHLRSPEFFVPLGPGRWGFWVSADLQTFVWIELGPDDRLLIEAGVWHHGPIPLNAPIGIYIMTAETGTEPGRTEWRDLPFTIFPSAPAG